MLVALTGVPLLSALALAATPSLGWAVALCLAVALAGVAGAIAGMGEILRWGAERQRPHAAEVDALARRDRS